MRKPGGALHRSDTGFGGSSAAPVSSAEDESDAPGAYTVTESALRLHRELWWPSARRYPALDRTVERAAGARRRTGLSSNVAVQAFTEEESADHGGNVIRFLRQSSVSPPPTLSCQGIKRVGGECQHPRSSRQTAHEGPGPLPASQRRRPDPLRSPVAW